MDIKRVTFAANFKSVEETATRGVIEGYGSVFGVIDSDNDVVDKGAFVRSLGEMGMPAMLLHHSSSEPGGVWLSAEEDEVGLKLRGELNLEVQRAREHYALVKQGALKGLSIGYMPRGSKMMPDGVRRLTDVDLYEVSLVTFPANRSAKITGLKAEDLSERYVEDVLREAGIGRDLAKAIVAKGFKSAHALRDAGGVEIITGLQKTLSILRS